MSERRGQQVDAGGPLLSFHGAHAPPVQLGAPPSSLGTCISDTVLVLGPTRGKLQALLPPRWPQAQGSTCHLGR